MHAKCGDDCIAGFDARNVFVENCLLSTPRATHFAWVP